MKMGAYPALAKDVVRYVGQPTAIVVARTRGQARDAADAVSVDWQELPAVVDAVKALEPGAPQLHPEAAGNLIYDWEHRRRRGDRRRLRQGEARHQARHRQQPARPERDGAARGARRLRSGRRELHAVDDEPEPACRAAGPLRLLQRRARAQASGDRARCRRRLRLEDLHLPRRDRLPVGVEEVRRAGEVGRRPHRVVPLGRAWPRPRHARRDGVRRRQQDDRVQGRHDRQFRRLHVALLVLGPDLSLRDASLRPVRDPGDPRQRPRRLHQHVAGRRLSRRRAGRRRRFVDRAHRRDGGARARRVAGRAPAEEFCHHLPLPDAGHHDLRRRRLRGFARRRA